MKYSLFVTLFALGFTGLRAQTGQLSGKVIDAKTREPLPFANVYVNKTTMGTTTDTSGEFILKGIPLGNVEIVCSFIGYIPHQLKVIIAATGNTPLAFELNPDTQQLTEVEIKSSRDKTWEKQLKKFEKVFLGVTGDCTILNPWVIEFSNENNKLKAEASLPIEIENKLLGYKLFFQLKSFSYSFSGYSIIGNVRFVEMKTSNGKDALNWMKNRERAYLGSERHLMKSILDRKINKEGFVLYKERVKGKLRSRNFSYELDHNLTTADTTALLSPVAGTNEFRINIKDKIEVHYDYDFSLTRFYVDISYPVSWLETKNGYVLINQDGNILNGAEVTISGDMAGARVSSMLPLDYKPGSLITIELPKKFSATRLREKVYVNSDKPYYYAGDEIWFSAYMNYMSSGSMDTLSRVLYVDLLNGDGISTQNRMLQIDNGRASGSLHLPANIKPGNYILRAYTQWMRNYGISQFFYQPIPILSIHDGVDEIPRTVVDDDLLKINFDKPEYQKRSKVKMSLSLDTTAGESFMSGSFSVAVIDETLAVPVKEARSIKRDFSIPEPSKDILREFTFRIERGITLEGICKNKKGKAKKANLTILPENLENIYAVSTLDNGEFTLKDLIFYDSAKFGIQPADEKVVLKNRDTPPLPEKLPNLKLHLVPLDAAYVVASGDTLKSTLLKEVQLTEKRTRQYENSYAQPDHYIKSESIETYQNLATAIEAKIPDFRLFLYEAHWYITWRRGEFTRANGAPAEPALYIDQSLVVGETAGDRLVMINPAMIDHIEVSGMIGSNLGANGANGLISVFTKRVAEDAPFKGLPIVKARGFDRVKAFQGPDYSHQTNANNLDYRSTLYWNPLVNVTSTLAPVELSFFSSDHPGNYRVIVEGVTNVGNAVHAEAVIKVKEEH
jgi:hypothetical protein